MNVTDDILGSMFRKHTELARYMGANPANIAEFN